MKEAVPLQKLSRLFAKSLEKILKADPDYSCLVSDLTGTLKVTLIEWAVSVVFIPGDVENAACMSSSTREEVKKGLNIVAAPDYEGTPDVSLSGRVPDFLGLIARESSSVVKSQVMIQGDVRVLAKYQAFFKRWKVDIGHVLASVAGEGPARFLYNPLKKVSDFLKYQHQERLQDLKEVLYEEKRLLVPKTELEEFYDDLKALQLRVDRLAAKVS